MWPFCVLKLYFFHINFLLRFFCRKIQYYCTYFLAEERLEKLVWNNSLSDPILMSRFLRWKPAKKCDSRTKNNVSNDTSTRPNCSQLIANFQFIVLRRKNGMLWEVERGRLDLVEWSWRFFLESTRLTGKVRLWPHLVLDSLILCDEFKLSTWTF